MHLAQLGMHCIYQPSMKIDGIAATSNWPVFHMAAKPEYGTPWTFPPLLVALEFID